MNTTKKVVRVMPATANLARMPLNSECQKRRVAAYARVSTDTEEQLNSYEAQVNHYTTHIQENEKWEFAGIYTDEGISATTTKKRDGFNRMVKDALNGKIDLIITKSVSRFARNTVDTLTTVRKLKAKGIEVFFEKENIYTLDSKGELLITIMSSLAQEESRSISENVTWGQRKRMQDGRVSLPYKHFLGYEKGKDGLPAIVEEEAETIRLIYQLFLFGKSPANIATHLTNSGILTPSGKSKWRFNTIESILTNEKYKGDARLQKVFTVDFLTKKRKVNEGEVPQYYVENSHPAIITPEVFDLVQFEFKKRKAAGKWSGAAHCFSSRVFCGECGGLYGSKVWHSNSQYKRTVWQCNNKYNSRDKCNTPHLSEEVIQAAFIKAINTLIKDKKKIVQSYNEIVAVITDNTALEAERSDLHNECEVLSELMKKHINENAHTALNQDEYQAQYELYSARHSTARARLQDIEAQLMERTAKRESMTQFIKSIKAQADLITNFDEELWYATVEAATVVSKDKIVFTFRDGTEI